MRKNCEFGRQIIMVGFGSKLGECYRGPTEKTNAYKTGIRQAFEVASTEAR